MEAIGYWQLGASYSFLQMALNKSPNSLDFGFGARHRRLKSKAPGQRPIRFRFCQALQYQPHLSLCKCIDEAVPRIPRRTLHFGAQLTDHFQLSVVGQNLLQPHHVVESAGDPGPLVGIKRGVYGQITWKQ